MKAIHVEIQFTHNFMQFYCVYIFVLIVGLRMTAIKSKYVCCHKEYNELILPLTKSAGWDCGFESRWGHGCLCLVSVVCCPVQVSATGRSLVQRSPTGCGVSYV